MEALGRAAGELVRAADAGTIACHCTIRGAARRDPLGMDSDGWRKGEGTSGFDVMIAYLNVIFARWIDRFDNQLIR